MVEELQIKSNTKIGGRKFRLVSFVSVFLFTMSAVLAFKALTQPISFQVSDRVNTVQESASFVCSALAKPSSLFPQGGDIGEKQVYFTKLVNQLNMKIKLQISSDKPVSFSGSSAVLLKLKVDKLWERVFPLVKESPIYVKNATSYTVLDGIYPIDVKSLLFFVEQVEKETQTLPSEYILVVTPVIKAVTGDKVNLDYQPEYQIKLSKSLITTNHLPTQTKEIPVMVSRTKLGVFDVAGLTLPVLTARYVFSVLTVILLLLNIYLFLPTAKRLLQDNKGKEYEKINRKFRNRIVFASKISTVEVNGNVIRTESFGELLKIADEHEKQIICLADDSVGSGHSAYYIIDGPVLYTYEPMCAQGLG